MMESTFPAQPFSERSRNLLIPQRIDRQQARCLTRGIETEKHTDCRRKPDREHDRVHVERSPPAREMSDRVRAADAEQNAAESARKRERDGFDQELRQNVAGSRTDR